MLTTSLPPANASFFPKLALYPQYAAQQIASVQALNDQANVLAKADFQARCNSWMQGAVNHGIVMAGTKPVAPPAIVTWNTDSAYGVYVWQTAGDPVGICPDPPVVIPGKPGSIVGPVTAPDRLDLVLANQAVILAMLSKLK